MTFCSVLVRHTVCLLAFAHWFLGSAIIAYTLWMLSTSANIKHVYEGTTPVTYVAIGFGSLFFTNGLLGWMGSQNKRGGCMLKLFLLLQVLTIAAEIGGIISLSILKVKVTDIVEHTWMETNPKSRFLLQEQFECCGLTGPNEFARVADPIDQSCYTCCQDTSKEELSSMNRTTFNEATRVLILNKNGCKEKLVNWIFRHKTLWISAFGGFLLFQAFCFCITVSALNLTKGRSDSIESSDRLHSTTYM